MSSYDMVSTFTSARGLPVYLNEGQECLMLSPTVTKNDLSQRIREFRDVQFPWAFSELTSISSTLGLDGQPLIAALAGTLVQASNGRRASWITRVIHVTSVPKHAWISADYVVPKAESNSFAISKMPLSTQQAFFKKCAGSSIFTLCNLLHDTKARQYGALDLEDMLDSSLSAQTFVQTLYDRSLKERHKLGNFMDKRSGPERAEYKHCAVYDALLLFLADRQILLRPMMSPPFFNIDSRSIERICLTPSSLEFVDQMKQAYFTQQQGANNKSFEIKWDRQYRPIIYTVIACSTFRGAPELSAELFERLRTYVESKPSAESKMNVLAWLYKTLKPAYAAERLPHIFRGKRRTGPFQWTSAQYDAKTAYLFPSKELESYTPHNGIMRWAAFFEENLAQYQTKTISGIVTAMNTFLTWLVVTDRGAHEITDIRRADINDFGMTTEKLSFTGYLRQKGQSAQHFNLLIRRLSDIFERAIEEMNSSLPNPFHHKLDRLKVGAPRLKTSRSAMNRQVLELIREFNARDNFAFSKTRPAHRRKVMSRSTGRFDSIWYPAPAVAIDFLVCLPVRSFQARYLDSGEGDEYVTDFSHPDLPRTRNPSSLAVRGRRESALCAMELEEGATIAAIYMNTNKTSSDRECGYEIPWVDESLKKNLLELIDWQKEFNPIEEPIPCAELASMSVNPAVLARMKITFPIFRDPDEIDNRPISRELLSRYWDDLLRAVELDHRSKHRNSSLKLTNEVVLNKGNGKSEKRFQARYDLHSLRVSGITALIEAGLPPDLVMQIVGHSTVVMTLYYNNVSMATLHIRLKEVVEKSANLLRDGSGDGQLVDELLVGLMNTRGSETQAGRALLERNRGCGDGAITVMSHGICPGGDCETGGQKINEATGYGPVPRLACSLCRYRLTGPMFLPGLVLNANRLMYEFKEKGEQMRALNEELRKIDEDGAARVNILRSKIDAIDRETELLGVQWGAEVAYVKAVEEMFTAPKDDATGRIAGLPMIAGMSKSDIKVRVEKRSSFALMQSLVEGADEWFEFLPDSIIRDHREFLNEVLTAHNIDPFLLKLRGPARDRAAKMFGAAILSAIPDECIDGLHNGSMSLMEYPVLMDAIEHIQVEANKVGAVFGDADPAYGAIERIGR